MMQLLLLGILEFYMTKSLIAGLVGILVIGGAIMLVKKDKTASDPEIQQEGTTAMENKDDVPADFAGSINELLAFEKDITCTFTQVESGTTVEGTVYVEGKGKKVRGDFTMSQEGQTFIGSMIRMNNTGYTWGETPFGTFATKVSLDEPTSEKDQAVDFDETISYTCSPWKVDSSMFDLPSDVSFEDIDPAVSQINEAMSEVNDLQCSACDEIPDPSGRAQCKAALGC